MTTATKQRRAPDPERQARLKALRERFANLSEEDRKKILNLGIVATVEGHPLSMRNTILCHWQCRTTPTIVAGYQQWKRARKQVRKGEHGMTIWFPAGPKDEEGEILETRYYVTTVFDISQVEEITQ